MANRVIEWNGNWEETAPIIEEAVAKGEILEINLPRGEWDKLRNSRRELSALISPLANFRIQFLYTPNVRTFIFIGNGIFH